MNQFTVIMEFTTHKVSTDHPLLLLSIFLWTVFFDNLQVCLKRVWCQRFNVYNNKERVTMVSVVLVFI